MNRALLIASLCAVFNMAIMADSKAITTNDILKSAEWRVRDVVAESKFIAADKSGKVSNLNLELTRSDDPKAPVWTSSCTVLSATPADRAVTLALCIPVDAIGGIWWDNPQQTRDISGDKVFINHVDVGVGATFMASRYPLAVITIGDKAYCIALPVDPPRMARLLYDPQAKELRAEFDFGLWQHSKSFPSRADAAVIAYEVPAKWAFRQALDRYYKLYPKAFERKVKKGGIWMPFTPLNKIEHPEDFGIAYREMGYYNWDSLEHDEKYGVDSYVYVEPQTFWRELRGDGEKTYENYVKQLWEDALKGDQKSQATLTSGIEREDGRYDLYLEKVAYTPAAPFGVNCDPDVPTAKWGGWPSKSQYEMELFSKVFGWNGEKPVAGLDGVYIDSMEGWGTLQNYNREHWKATQYPLTFDTHTRRVCLFNFWGNYNFIKQLSQKLHDKDMLLMGNDAYFRFWFLAPHVDIPGREYSWIENGKFTPVPEERFLFFRSMSAQKPYVLLMNNAFDDAGIMEPYFQRSMFYGVYPSMFHGHSKVGETAYFYNKDWYNRDRHLFKKYIPLIKKLDFAGWEPVPYADASPDTIRIERFGKWEKKNLAFTVHNPAEKEQKMTLTLSKKDLRLPDTIKATEWISDSVLTAKSDNDNILIQITMKPNSYVAVGLE